MTFKNTHTTIALPQIHTPALLAGMLIFSIPFFFGHSQLATGTIVNSILLASAILFPRKYYLSIALLPSLAVLARGIIFGPLTIFLVYFLPFIWLSNLIFMQIFTKWYHKFKFIPCLLLASFIKTTFLFVTANIYFNFHLIPKVFLTSMGIIQLVTAIMGGGLVYFVSVILRSRVRR